MSGASECGERPASGTGCRLRGGSASTASPATTPPHNHGGKQAGAARPGKPCCFCWCCCCSCSCLAQPKLDDSKANAPGSPDAFNGEPAPTLDEIRSWGKSFDRLMRSPAGRKVFREFLRCEYSEENILFWQACEELKKESNPEVVEEKARFIYEDYISILSPKEVSLDSRVRDIVNRNMVDPTPHTFDEAQLQIYTLMHRDSYPRFVNSELYKQLAQLGAGDGSPPGALQQPPRRDSSA
ncbi:regulator of G-protein signaling 20 isoform X2 [Bacillus rossius redtenbacheri]